MKQGIQTPTQKVYNEQTLSIRYIYTYKPTKILNFFMGQIIIRGSYSGIYILYVYIYIVINKPNTKNNFFSKNLL